MSSLVRLRVVPGPVRRILFLGIQDMIFVVVNFGNLKQRCKPYVYVGAHHRRTNTNRVLSVCRTASFRKASG